MTSTTTASIQMINPDSWRYRTQGMPAKDISNVCRNILGKSDPSATKRLLSDALLAEKHRAVRCLNFDIGSDKPMETKPSQRFEWCTVSSGTLPVFYGKDLATKKQTSKKETSADAILREKTERFSQYNKVLRLIQDSPNNRRPSSAPCPSQMTPVKKVFRPFAIHPKKPVLSSATLTNLPTVTDSPSSDTENHATVNSFQTPIGNTQPSVLKKRLAQAPRERKQQKITGKVIGFSQQIIRDGIFIDYSQNDKKRINYLYGKRQRWFIHVNNIRFHVD